MKTIEEKIKHCQACKKQTKHQRNGTTTGFVMILIHILLTLMTVGGWLVPLIFWHIANAKVGGWMCEKCGR